MGSTVQTRYCAFKLWAAQSGQNIVHLNYGQHSPDKISAFKLRAAQPGQKPLIFKSFF
jgi:hypothetical protein